MIKRSSLVCDKKINPEYVERLFFVFLTSVMCKQYWCLAIFEASLL